MPHFDPERPLRRTTELTKTLRSRDTPLLSLLPLAKEIADGDRGGSNLFFPHRTEWLLEWAVQRLAEEQGRPGREARTSPSFWDFLLHLLRNTSPLTIGGVLRRHGILSTLSQTLSELSMVPDDEAGEEEEVFSTPREVASPALSTPDVEPGNKAAHLLDSLTAVVVYLRQLGKTENSIKASLRGNPEIGATIVGAFLRLVKNLLGRGVLLEEAWVGEIVELWRGCIWGIADTKKISVVWANSCLLTATTLLGIGTVPKHLTDVLEAMIMEYIFPAEILYPPAAGAPSGAAKPSPKDLIPLLAPLKPQSSEDRSALTLRRPPTFLPELLRVGVRSQKKRRNVRPDMLAVDAIFQALLSTAFPSSTDLEALERRGEMVVALLTILVESDTTLPRPTLSGLVVDTANLRLVPRSCPRWTVVKMVLKLDYDAFLAPENSKLADQLFTALSHGDEKDEDIWAVLELLIDAFVATRDIPAFISHWRVRLSSNTSSTIWKSDRLAKLVAKVIERALTPISIDGLVKKLVKENDWVVVDAMLRGIKREETATLLAKSTFPQVIDAALSLPGDWRRWRAIVRIAEAHPELLQFRVQDAIMVIEKEQWREGVFAAGVLLRNAAFEGTPEALDKAKPALALISRSLGYGCAWDSNIESVDEQTFGVALATGIIARHLTALERTDSTIRLSFINTIFEAAEMQALEWLWWAMLENDLFYECPGLKDAALAVLWNHLSPWSDMTSDMPVAATNILSQSKQPHLNERQIRLQELVLQSLLSFPLEAMKRYSREKFVDALFLMDQAHVYYAWPVIERLWKVGNASSYMATEPEALKMWFQNHEQRNSELTTRRLLQHAFQTKDQDKSREYLRKTLAMVNQTLIQSDSHNITQNRGYVSMCYVLITEFWTIREDHTVNVDGMVEALRLQFLGLTTPPLLTLLSKRDNELRSPDIEMIGWWRAVWTLDRTAVETKHLANDVALGLMGAATPLLAAGRPSTKYNRVLKEALEFICAVSEDAEQVAKATALAVVVLENGLRDDDREQVLVQYADCLARLNTSDYRTALLRVFDGCFDDSEVGESVWDLLKSFIKGTNKPDDEEELSKTLDLLTALHTKLALGLSKTRSAKAFRTAAECIDVLLREKPWYMLANQHVVDMTLAAITRCLSPISGPSISAPSPDELYVALTRLLTSVLTMHRRRISGRHHLVVNNLQHLLTALFTPKTARRKMEAPTHPPWLLTSPTASTATTGSGLTFVSARAFSRVLEAFCQPPTSTVRRKGGDLTTSDTAKEKAHVQNVVGAVLEVYVKRMLELGMEADIRKEVAVGVDAVLAVLGSDGVRRVNANVDVPGRAAVKSLWTQWKTARGEMV